MWYYFCTYFSTTTNENGKTRLSHMRIHACAYEAHSLISTAREIGYRVRTKPALMFTSHDKVAKAKNGVVWLLLC